MKKVFLVVGFFSSLLLLYIAFTKIQNNSSPLAKDLVITTYNIEGKTYRLYVADTPKKQEKGLMYFTSLPENVDGMIFFFPDIQKRTFWNKNTYLSLDVFWIRDKQIMGKAFLPSISKSRDYYYVHSPDAVDTVVELVQDSQR